MEYRGDSLSNYINSVRLNEAKSSYSRREAGDCLRESGIWEFAHLCAYLRNPKGLLLDNIRNPWKKQIRLRIKYGPSYDLTYF